MNEDINLRVKFIQEIERHPFLYDHNHVYYNHRDKIEAAWKNIGEICGEGSETCKKKWRLIRCSYTRSLKKTGTGGGPTRGHGYYMARHLKFLDPFLKSRTGQENPLSEEEDGSLENMNSSGVVQVTVMDNVKAERDYEDDYEDSLIDESNTQESLTHKRSLVDEDVVTRKRVKMQDDGRKRDLTPNEMYLLSLAPYLDNMTERQKLTLQKGVIQLIEDIKYGAS